MNLYLYAQNLLKNNLKSASEKIGLKNFDF